MKKRPDWTWQILFIAYLFIAIIDTIAFFSPEHSVFLYYHFLMAFDVYFFIPYLFNLISVILNLLAIVPFYLFIKDIPILTKNFWKCFLLVRLLFELAGHCYDINTFKSLYYQELWSALSFACSIIAMRLPSYIALWNYSNSIKEK